VPGGITIVEGITLPASGDMVAEKALLSDLGKFRKRATARHADYRDALLVGGQPLHHAEKHLLTSFAVKFVAALDAAKRMPSSKRRCLTDLAEISHGVKLNGPSSEPVLAWRIAKSAGGWRTVQKFGIANKIGQQVGRTLLAYYLSPRPWQHDFTGVHTALSEVAKAIAAGRIWMAHADIKGFYPSFNRKEVRTLTKTPKALTDFFLVGEFLNVQPLDQEQLDASSIYDLLSDARKGVPQGSSASPLIGITALSHMPWTPPSDTTAVFYCDNMGLLCATEGEAEAGIKALRATVEALPTGKFETKLVGIDNVNDGFDFLGVHFRYDDGLTIIPTAKNHARFFQKIDGLLEAAYEAIEYAMLAPTAYWKNLAAEAVGRLRRFGRGWLNAFQLCTNIGDYEKAYSTRLDQLNDAAADCSLEFEEPYLGAYDDLVEFVSG
jgi:hypothetical protein